MKHQLIKEKRGLPGADRQMNIRGRKRRTNGGNPFNGTRSAKRGRLGKNAGLCGTKTSDFFTSLRRKKKWNLAKLVP